MIKSMTGYGGAKGSVEGLEIAVELKSVNNRYLDTSVRLPRSFPNAPPRRQMPAIACPPRPAASHRSRRG